MNPKYLKVLLVFLCLAAGFIRVNAQAVLFNQDFTAGGTYVTYQKNLNPSSGQWNGIAVNNSAKAWTIDSNALRLTSTGGGVAFASRITDFSPVPSALKITFTFQLVSSTTSLSPAFEMFLGNSFGLSGVDPTVSTTFAKFGFSTSAVNTFKVRDTTANVDGPSTFSGTQAVTWVLNNTGAALTYTAPNGSMESLANDTWDLWIGTTKEFDDRAATTPSQRMADWKFGTDNSGTFTMSFDNFNVSTVVSGGGSTPAAPSSLTATGGSGVVSLNWPTVSGASSYNVKSSTSSGGPFTIEASPTNNNYTDTSVTSGTTYYYVVSAMNLSGESPNSIVAAATPSAPSGAVSFLDDWAADPVKGGWAMIQVTAANRLQRDLSLSTWHGQSTARIEVRPLDDPISSTGERSEVLAMKSGAVSNITEDNTTGTQYYGMSYFLPTNWQSTAQANGDSGWSIVFQLHGPDSLGASPSFALYANTKYQLCLWGGDLSAAGSAPTIYNFSDGGVYQNGSGLNLGAWSDFIIRATWASSPTGSVTIWRRNQGETDFAQVLDVANVATLQYRGSIGVGPHYWKHGLYRGESPTITNVLWTGPLSRGTSFSAVELATFGTSAGQPLAPVAAPAFNPVAGSYGSTQSVAITTPTTGATIRYTTNGSTPTPTSGTIYSGPFSVSGTATIKAIAYNSGMSNSIVSSGTYTIVSGTSKLDTPTSGITVSSGTGSSNTVDEDLATYWAVSGDGQWIQYDLGSVRTVAFAKIAWNKGDLRYVLFDILASTDGTNWTTLLQDQLSSGNTVRLETCEFNDTLARYIRIVGYGSNVNAWTTITEAEAWGY